MREAAVPLVKVAAALAVFAVPFLAYATVILRCFYLGGSSFYDAGWSAFLIHDADWQVHNPPVAVDDGLSWFDGHISPLFLVTSGLGHLLPLSRIQFYAAYTGLSHALPAVAVFWMLVTGWGMTTPGRRVAAALLALLFAFNGLALAIARYPHFIVFLVGAGSMFLAALVLRRYRIAALFFALCLATREDAGFHLFALLALALAWEWRRGAAWPELKPIALFAAAALLYSAGALAWQHAHATVQSLLVIEYLGQPPFGNVTPGLIGRRLLGWIAYRGYVVFPALVALAWAILRREPRIVLGYAAFVPWGLLHLAAAKDLQATLPSYYAFPFMFAMLWPLLGLLLWRRAGGPQPLTEAIAGFALMVAVSFAPSPYLHNPTHIALPRDFVGPPPLARQAATDRALAQLASAPALGTQVLDQSTLAIVPERYRPANMLRRPHPAPDTIIYFVDGLESAASRKEAAKYGLARHYAIPGTSIRVATDRDAAGIAGLVEQPVAQ